MKRQQSVMSCLLLLVGVSICAAASAGNAQTHSAQKSVTQIKDTLRNLLRSVEDAGQDADALFRKRQTWCSSAILSFETAGQQVGESILDMHAQITETQARVEEAEGTVHQMEADIEMVQHTIKQTEEMLKHHKSQVGDDGSVSILASLIENKQLTLASLKGQLDIAVPVLSRLQANVADMEQRVSYRTESSVDSKDFVVALKDGCQAASNHADAQSEARLGETNSIQVALQGLEEMVASIHPQDFEGAISFVQVSDQSQEVSIDDLTDLFADSPGHYAPALRASPSVPQGNPRVKASPLRPRIQALLTQLKNTSTMDLDQDAWCEKQRLSSEMAVRFAQNSVDQVKLELESHRDAEAEISEELETLHASAGALLDATKMASDQAAKEERLMQSSSKDQQLATKILEQASTILKELVVLNTTKVLLGLASAQKMLASQMSGNAVFKHEASLKAEAMAQKAQQLARTQASEQHNLEFARDDHSSQRFAAVENQHLYEADVKEASSYLQKLEANCNTDARSKSRQQYSVQVHALEDADKALQGKLIEATTRGSLRGRGHEQVPLPKNLTPMQRAAMEMGVSLDA